MTPAGIIRMTPSQAAAVAKEYCGIGGGYTLNSTERLAIWLEYCERQHRSEAKVWLRVLAVLAIVAAFFAGFAAAAVGLVR